MSWIRRVPNLDEFFVHHEDVRRASGRGPRTSAPALDQALWANATGGAWLLARRLAGLRARAPLGRNGPEVPSRRGVPAALIDGLMGEMQMYLFGRQQAAEVEIDGPEVATEAVREKRFGM